MIMVIMFRYVHWSVIGHKLRQLGEVLRWINIIVAQTEGVCLSGCLSGGIKSTPGHEEEEEEDDSLYDLMADIIVD